MYRLETAEELVEKGILDEIQNFDCIVIEWPKFEEIVDYGEFLLLEIIKTSETERSVKNILTSK